MNQNKIVPALWYNAQGAGIANIINYYQTIFGDHLQAGPVMPLGDTPSGNTELCEVHIFGQKYMMMATANEHHPFNDASAFTINCEDQAEIDKYWDYFVQEGQEVQCGWCIDKFGLRWQVLPQNLPELMSRPNAFETMMKQKKIIIAEY